MRCATKIHAVTAAGGLGYAYDANGNVTTRSGSSVTWYASNLPKSIANGSYTSTFEYGPNRNYWKQTATYSNGTETTRYIGGLLEIVQGPSVTSWRHSIQANGITVALYSRGSNGSNNTTYPLRDHLGSTEAITNSSGAIVVKTSFAAFGARRGGNWTGAPSAADMTAIGDATRRGFTDHSMLDNVGLVHMNGRVFDPVVGRFLSSDPNIDGVMDTQGWNRYSYVKNNPLTWVDPSGFVAALSISLGGCGSRSDCDDPFPSSTPSMCHHLPYGCPTRQFSSRDDGGANEEEVVVIVAKKPRVAGPTDTSAVPKPVFRNNSHCVVIAYDCTDATWLDGGGLRRTESDVIVIQTSRFRPNIEVGGAGDTVNEGVDLDTRGGSRPGVRPGVSVTAQLSLEFGDLVSGNRSGVLINDQITFCVPASQDSGCPPYYGRREVSREPFSESVGPFFRACMDCAKYPLSIDIFTRGVGRFFGGGSVPPVRER